MKRHREIPPDPDVDIGLRTGRAQAAAVQREVNLFDAGIGASWEMNLFGGLRRGVEASRADAAAADDGLAGVRPMIVAKTADAYLQLRDFQPRDSLADRRVKDDAKVLELPASWRKPT